MFFRQIEVGPMQDFSYIIGCEKTKESAIIDCGFEPEKLLHIIQKKGYVLKKIFLTHVHYDHSGAAEELSKNSGAEIFMHPESRKKVNKSTQKGMWIIPQETTDISEGDSPFVGEIKGKVISAPGHQSDHLLYIFGEYLFTGDVLFIDGIGRTDLPDSSPEEMKNTLNKFFTLPENLIVCPGHDYGSVTMRTLEQEKKYNIHLK